MSEEPVAPACPPDPTAGFELGPVLVSEKEIAEQVANLGEQITHDYAGRAPCSSVC